MCPLFLIDAAVAAAVVFHGPAQAGLGEPRLGDAGATAGAHRSSRLRLSASYSHYELLEYYGQRIGAVDSVLGS